MLASRNLHSTAQQRTALRSPLVRGRIRQGLCRAEVATGTDYVMMLRKAAMALHTREQLGQKSKGSNEATEEGAGKNQKPEPTLSGYLRFLRESKVVFDCYENIIAESDDPHLSLFRGTGLERGEALTQDLKWFTKIYAMEPDAVDEDGPGSRYVAYLSELAKNDTPAFICHYYNTYFAHMSGGAMIGKMVSKKILDGHELEFYKYPGGQDPKEIGVGVKDKLQKVSEDWTDAELQRSLDETKATFAYSTAILSCIYQE